MSLTRVSLRRDPVVGAKPYVCGPQIDSKLFDRMDRVWSELPADWDILMLGYAAPKPAQQWYEPDAEKDVDRMYWASQ